MTKAIEAATVAPAATPKPIETQAQDIYSHIDSAVPKALDKMKMQEDAFVKQTQGTIDDLKSHAYTPQVDTQVAPKLKTLKQSLGSFGSILTAVISVLAVRDGGDTALNFANMYNGMAESLRKNNLQEFMAKSEEFKNNIIKLKTNNEDKLQQYQEYMSSILTGNKLEAQKLEAKLQPEKLTITSLLSEGQLFNKTLERTEELQKLAYSVNEAKIRQEDEQQRMELTRRGQNIYAATANSQIGKNKMATESYLSSMIGRFTKLNQTGQYNADIIHLKSKLRSLENIPATTQIKAKPKVVTPVAKKAKSWWGNM